MREEEMKRTAKLQFIQKASKEKKSNKMLEEAETQELKNVLEEKKEAKEKLEKEIKFMEESMKEGAEEEKKMKMKTEARKNSISKIWANEEEKKMKKEMNLNCNKVDCDQFLLAQESINGHLEKSIEDMRKHLNKGDEDDAENPLSNSELAERHDNHVQEINENFLGNQYLNSD